MEVSCRGFRAPTHTRTKDHHTSVLSHAKLVKRSKGVQAVCTKG